MTGETTTEEPVAEKKSLTARVLHEVRETAITIAVFVPFWLVFSTFVYELRSIPSESMVPALQIGDRVAVAKFAYGYNRNSIPFGIGHLFMGDDKDKPDEGVFVRTPQRGEVVVFQHPRVNRVMIKRVIGLPGDTVQMRDGLLHINGEPVEREEVRRTTYVQGDNGRMVVNAIEYRETLPGQKGSHLVHEIIGGGNLRQTPIFRIPAGNVFFMGDNRDNSEDSRAPSGHRGMWAQFPEAWSPRPAVSPNPDDDAVGYVPLDHLIGRADTVLFTLYSCRLMEGVDCAAPRLWKGL